MENGFKALSMTVLMAFMTMVPLAVYVAEGGGVEQVVLTPALRITNDAGHSWQSANVKDDTGNLHVVYSSNRGGIWQLYYEMVSSGGNGNLIDDTQLTASPSGATDPDIAIDSRGHLHIVWMDRRDGNWEIYYMQLDPSNDDQDGSSAQKNAIATQTDTKLTADSWDSAHPAVAIDENDDSVHISWDDTRDPTGVFFNHPQIYYTMLNKDGNTLIDDTILTPILGHKGHPDLTVMPDGLVNIVWDDTRGGNVDMVWVVDTSGSMYDEWATICSVILGGGGTQGIVARLAAANISVEYDIFGMQSSGGFSCGTPLNTCRFNGAQISPSSEDWGPCSNWAAYQYVVGDSQTHPTGNTWRANATRIVMAVSDEDPYQGGFGAWSSGCTTPPSGSGNTDCQSIAEAIHASNTGPWKQVYQVPFHGNNQGPGTSVYEFMHDLGTGSGGNVFAFDNEAGVTEAIITIATNRSRDIFTTTLNPSGAAHNGGPADDNDQGTVAGGGFVVMNDTALVFDQAYSYHPSVDKDGQSNLHVVWHDGRDHGFEKEAEYEVYYEKYNIYLDDLNGDGGSDWNMARIEDVRISDFDTTATIPNDRSWFAGISLDKRDNAHIVYLDHSNATAGEQLMYTKINATTSSQPDPWELLEITHTQSNKMGIQDFSAPDRGTPPGMDDDVGSGLFVTWSDTLDDGSNTFFETYYVHLLTGSVEVELDPPSDKTHVIEPDEWTSYNFTVNNTTPGTGPDVRDSYTIDLITTQDTCELGTSCGGNWSSAIYWNSNGTRVYNTTAISLNGGEGNSFQIVIYAPSIYQAHEDETNVVDICAFSAKDEAITDCTQTVTIMDVVYGLDIDSINNQHTVEQGGTTFYQVSITNTGNVRDTIECYDVNTIGGAAEWNVPFNWTVTFLTQIQLEPQQTSQQLLKVSVPTDQSPGQFVLYVKCWSNGDAPPHSLPEGTFDIQDIYVNVAIQTSGAVQLIVEDNVKFVLPGQTVDFIIYVEKNFSPGDLNFQMQGTILPGWTVALSETSGFWASGETRPITMSMTAPADALADELQVMNVRGGLANDARVFDVADATAIVAQNYDIDVDLWYDSDPDPGSVTPVGQFDTAPLVRVVNPDSSITIFADVENLGNGWDAYTLLVEDVPGGWNVQGGQGGMLLHKIHNPTDQAEILITVPQGTDAGTYDITVKAISEGPIAPVEAIISVVVNKVFDLDLKLGDDLQSKGSAPGRTVQFDFELRNLGNTEDTFRMTVWTYNANSNPPWVKATSNTETAVYQWPTTFIPSTSDIGFVPRTADPNACLETEGCMMARVEIEIPSSADLGDYDYIVQVQSLGAAPTEDDENALGFTTEALVDDWMDDNNEELINIKVRAPDLTFVGEPVYIEEDHYDIDSNLPITVRVTNQGNIYATGVTVALYVDDNPFDWISEEGDTGLTEKEIEDFPTPVYSEELGNIKPGDTLDVLLFYQVQAGDKELHIIVDPPVPQERQDGNKIVYDLSDEIAESNENNNVLDSFNLQGGNFASQIGSVFTNGAVAVAALNILAVLVLVALVIATLFLSGALKKKDDAESRLDDAFEGGS